MTTTTVSPASRNEPAAPGNRTGGAPAARRRAWAGRAGTVLVVVAGLLTASLARPWAVRLQADLDRTGPYAGGGATPAATKGGDGGGASFGNLDSFTLALLLGGLRGPLVMFLWSTSESQKNDRDLEDFDTKVELIRLLQPEFDTVQLFQIWNKAYNISAQMASLPNKYAAILDALDYARNVDASRPNNVNIVAAISQLFSQKLGGAPQDKPYYIRRVREETKYRAPTSAGTGAGDARRASSSRRRLDPILGADGTLLPELVKATRPPPAGLQAKVYVPPDELDAFRKAAQRAGVTLPASADAAGGGSAGAEAAMVTLDAADAGRLRAAYDPRTPASVMYIPPDWNDGADMQYLVERQPYPYGVSPLALGYNYGKRAQVLMTSGGQRPLQTSMGVIDSQPPLQLKEWAEDEWQRATEAELRVFGKEIPPERHPMELPTAPTPPDAPLKDDPATRALLDEAVFEYGRAADVSVDAIREFRRHLGNADEYIIRMQDYSTHIDTLVAQWHLQRADAAYLRAVTLPPGDAKRDLLEHAAADYRRAATWYHYLDVRYYVPSDLAARHYPRGVDRLTLADLARRDPDAMDALYDVVMADLAARKIDDLHADSREEGIPYWQRADQRLAAIHAYLHPGTTRPARPTPKLGPPALELGPEKPKP